MKKTRILIMSLSGELEYVRRVIYGVIPDKKDARFTTMDSINSMIDMALRVVSDHTFTLDDTNVLGIVIPVEVLKRICRDENVASLLLQQITKSINDLSSELLLLNVYRDTLFVDHLDASSMYINVYDTPMVSNSSGELKELFADGISDKNEIAFLDYGA